MRAVVAVLAVMAMVAALCACSKAAASEPFEGELIDAQNDRLVVRSADETMLFATTDATVYDLQDQEILCVGDKVSVNYHKGEEMFVADTVTLTEHEADTLVFGGEVTELESDYVTVQSESLAVVFGIDEATKVEGDLSKGDSVTVTYDGNISENPHAISIVVIQEQQEKAERSIRGTVSEVADTSVIVSIGSAHARRFQITSDTTITGDDTKLKVGDEVRLIYTGDIDDKPVAKSITITRNNDQVYFVMDGVIESASADKVVLQTATRTYTFNIVKDTRIQNPKYLAAGHMATITYVGELGKNPTAASVFCSKDTAAEKGITDSKSTAQSTDDKKPAQSANNGKASEPAQSNKPADSADNKADKPSQDAQGDKKDDQGDKKDEPAQDEQGDEGTEPTQDEQGDEGGEATEPAQDEQGDEGTEPATDDQGGEGEEATTDDKSDDTAPEGDEGDDKGSYYDEYGVIAFKAKGEIVEWGKSPSVFKLDGSSTIELDIKDAKVSGGYIPKVGDQVVIIYSKDDMKLLEIQLEYRPAAKPAQ